ncbi:hypothetical protein PVK06_036603 [Gossypium arboreum]|uniref:DUF4283 domain-containing protein n=1 Tax=Gossypium arboreum TaxID=29729 RepID=A0ABR0NJY5_GOSAR|nr:hypothetical protein PVK06_036603 [Gossypium arboreum]
MKVPLIYTTFWVQVHDLPLGLFTESIAKKLGDFMGHNDYFCQARMAKGLEVVEMGWYLSLKAQSRRVAAMNSVWLRKDGEGKIRGNTLGRFDLV